jgi:uncharacterized repeat protein (TIGR03847 family)
MTADFASARAVDAQVFGEPGQRTFQLRIIGAHEDTASLWLEKQHLQALNLWLAQMLAQVDYRGQPQTPDLSAFPVAAQHDFKVGRLSLGLDPSDRAVVLEAHELALEEDAEPSLRVRLTHDQCAWLVSQLGEIIATGRPVCPLCGISIDSDAHTCIRSNGHSREPIPDDRADAEEDGT